MLDAHQLNVFLVAAETLNFTHTAQRLHMTQPSVSQHVQSLEKHFGSDLFLRNGRHIELTEAGRALMPLAREMVGISHTIEDSMASIKGRLVGGLTLAVSSPAAWFALPDLLLAFQGHYPGVRLQCMTLREDQGVEALCTGRVDVLFSAAMQLDCRETQSFTLLTDTLELLVPAGHPFTEMGAVSAADLAEQPLLLPPSDTPAFMRLAEGLQGAGVNLHDITPAMLVDDPQATARCILAGLGIGFVPGRVTAQWADRKLAAIAVNGVRLDWPLNAHRLTSFPASAALEAFWTVLGADTR